MNKIIFLDIDGVLNVYCEERDEFGCIFHKHFEENLKWIIEETNAKIVISSTWRMSGLKVMQEMWKHRNLAGDIIDVTPFSAFCVRGEEIQTWLDNNEVLNYVIIDDDDDMLPTQKSNFVKTSNNQHHPDSIDIGYGLTKKCAEMAIQILNNTRNYGMDKKK